MADVSTMTAAQIDAAATAGALRIQTANLPVSFANAVLAFHTGPDGTIYVTARSGDAAPVSRKVADIVGPASASNAMTGAEATQLNALLKRLYVFLLHP